MLKQPHYLLVPDHRKLHVSFKFDQKLFEMCAAFVYHELYCMSGRCRMTVGVI